MEERLGVQGLADVTGAYLQLFSSLAIVAILLPLGKIYGRQNVDDVVFC
jgi:hypothetical protein